MPVEFKKGMRVCYQGNTGEIDFIDNMYIRIKLPASPGRGHPLLLVFPEYWHEVEILEDMEVENPIDTYHSQDGRYSDPQ